MENSQMYRSQSLRRVQQYLTTRADVLSAANSSDARRQLDSAITAVDAAAAAQGTIGREVRGEVRRRAQLERLLVRKYMSPLAKFARASLKGVPDLAALTPSARNFKSDRLVGSARSMAAAAVKYTAQLERAKFPKDFLSQMRATTDAVVASLDAYAAKFVTRTGSTKSIRTAVAEGRRAIAALDAIVSHTILGDETLEREWRTVKRVRQSASPASPNAVAGSIAPAITSAATSAEVTKAAA